jgi:hypothetical protein
MFPNSEVSEITIPHYSSLFHGSPDFQVDVDDVSKTASLLRDTIGFFTTDNYETNEQRFEQLCENPEMFSAFQVVGDVTKAAANAHVRLEEVFENATGKSLSWQTETQGDKRVAELEQIRYKWRCREADRKSRRLDEIKARTSEDAGNDGESYGANLEAESAAASILSEATIVPTSHPRARRGLVGILTARQFGKSPAKG